MANPPTTETTMPTLSEADRATWAALVAAAVKSARLAAAAQHDLSAWRERIMVTHDVPEGYGFDPNDGRCKTVAELKG